MNVIHRVILRLKVLIFPNSAGSSSLLDLEMILPSENLVERQYVLHSDYEARQYQSDDFSHFMSLINHSGLTGCSLDYWNKQVLPDGFFIIIHKSSGSIVGACMAAHYPKPRHPLGGCLGWLAVDPLHHGKGIGGYLTGCVMNRLIKAGYKRIFLGTQDFRLSAIKTYLKLGWVPYLYEETMKERWIAVSTAIEWQFTPNSWVPKEEK